MISWKSFSGNKLFWPIVSLAILLLFNLFFTPRFFAVQIMDGHFYGNVIDIIKNAARKRSWQSASPSLSRRTVSTSRSGRSSRSPRVS